MSDLTVRTPTRRRRLATALAALAAVAVLSGCLTAEQRKAQDLVNADRAAQPAHPIFGSLHALEDYSPADAKAQAWAKKLAADGALSHSKLTDGYGSETSWCYLGENVGMGPSLEAIEAAFMASPSHRANIVSWNYDHIGTGVVYVESTGYYFVVQEFVDLC